MKFLTWCVGILATLCMGMGIITCLGAPQAFIDSISGVFNGALAFYEFWFWVSALLFLATIALAVAGGGGGGGGGKEEY